MTMRELDRIIDELMENRRKYFLYEVQTDIHDNVYKCALRTSYDLDKDISIVFNLSKDGKLIVKTAWLNGKSDKHFTLDKTKYFNPNFKKSIDKQF